MNNPILVERLNGQLITFLGPVLNKLEEKLDYRLVKTFIETLKAIIKFRHGSNGLLLSELGGYLSSPDQAPAGTKRLSRLLHNGHWTAALISTFLWEQADQRVKSLHQAGEKVLVVWDESVLEKPESIALEGLCAVRSRTAARLKRVRPGFYCPPSGTVFVPGWPWLSLLVLGHSGPPVLAAMRWWTTRGEQASDLMTQVTQQLESCLTAWGSQALHIFDRGFANDKWLTLFASYPDLQGLVRWNGKTPLINTQGSSQPAWQLVRGKRTWEYRYLKDTCRNGLRRMGVFALPVTHPAYPGTLYLVVCRRGKGQTPWYLLTTEKVTTPEAAWHIVLAYARRWQIEMSYRFGKSGLAMESVRLRDTQSQQKLLLMATLVHTFLLSLLTVSLKEIRASLLRQWCHRTGQKLQTQVKMPLYRLSTALSRLWLAFAPPPIDTLLNLG